MEAELRNSLEHPAAIDWTIGALLGPTLLHTAVTMLLASILLLLLVNIFATILVSINDQIETAETEWRGNENTIITSSNSITHHTTINNTLLIIILLIILLLLRRRPIRIIVLQNAWTIVSQAIDLRHRRHRRQHQAHTPTITVEILVVLQRRNTFANDCEKTRAEAAVVAVALGRVPTVEVAGLIHHATYHLHWTPSRRCPSSRWIWTSCLECIMKSTLGWSSSSKRI